ncbi:LLM class flavin-dependent oxidoreductase [Pseudonocardia endophytica]|uniref:Luciferase-like monooxygenase n=1 Tax=Pseudonocardia endophytica TaxID=401976 RepID=A0A4R1HLS9_PSEEN|nr:LLM class flavin-dependent oxidoreductase [Pseudonocardia endophytica]TCK22061.1 luciferase-like monooxygenase [Pseudonocardia endophytica]
MSEFDELAERVAGLECGGADTHVLDARPDPFVVAAALAMRTTRIRLVVPVDTADVHPYTVARRLAALDKISDGRVSWAPHDTDPRRRAESVRIVRALLGSWQPGAVVNDTAAGVHVDTSRVLPVRIAGAFWATDSALDVPAGPQGIVPVVDVAVVEPA